MAGINLAARFLLEIVAIAAVGYWGYQTGSGPLRWVLAIGTPLVLIAVWAIGIAPGAVNPIPQPVRVVLGSGVLLLAAAALFVAGARTPALLFAALIVVNTVLLFALGHAGA